MKSFRTLDLTRDRAAFAHAFGEMLNEFREIVARSRSAVVIDYSDMRSKYGPN